MVGVGLEVTCLVKGKRLGMGSEVTCSVKGKRLGVGSVRLVAVGIDGSLGQMLRRGGFGGLLRPDEIQHDHHNIVRVERADTSGRDYTSGRDNNQLGE